MKHFYLKSLFAGLLLFAASNSFAYDFEVDGIYYNILSEEEKTVEVTSGDSYTGDIVIPENVENNNTTYTVTSVGMDAFSESDIQTVSIPKTVTIIKGDAFMRCRKLNSVTIPNSVTTIEMIAFYGCNSLTEIHLPESLESIGNYAFDFCTKLAKINIPNSIKKIGEYAFADCTSLTSIELPSSISIIERGLFSSCYNLTNCVIPNSIKKIEDRAFSECRSLQSINIPNSVTTLEDYAFYGCYSLSSVFIPNSVTTIGYSAFEQCSGLTSVTIPSSVTTIEDAAFCACSGLTSVTIPNSVTNIGNATFAYCNGLTSVTIPNSVTIIGEKAFTGCHSLKEVISYITEPFAINNNSWPEDIRDNIPLYVPVGTKELYESTPGWNLFKNIVEMGLTPVEEDSGEKDFGASAGIDEDTKMDGNIVNVIFYNILEDNGFYNREEGCIVIKKETVDEFLDYIENKNLFSDEVKQQFTGLALMLKANCQWLKITAEASGNMTLKVKIGNMPPMEMALDGKKTVELPCSLSEPAMAYIYGSLLPHAGAKGIRRAKAGETADELKIYSIAWSEEQEASGISHTEQQDATAQPAVYNLQGQRVIPSRQGIYISNGKKLFVK